MVEFDPGPPQPLAQHLAGMPSYASRRDFFWYDWGPVFYRGRLDGSARLLGIASDPGPTERIANRTLVGDAGQRVQGFLAKLGLTRSYALVNAYAYALQPSKADEARPLLSELPHRTWRNAFYDQITGANVQAIVAFGREAQAALELWDTRLNVPAGVKVIKAPHPSSHNEATLVSEWHKAIQDLRAVVTPDADGDASGPNYSGSFRESDYTRIPPRDLPFGVPAWLGDDAWGRTAQPRHNNSVSRPSSDLKHTLVWRAPTDQP
jgi:uracil-DNA glycosylase